MLASPLSQAASPEGIVVLAVLYFIFALIGKAKKSAGKTPRPRVPVNPPSPESAAPAQNPFSLEAVLREIERVKQEAQRRESPPATGHPRFSNPAPKPKPVGERPRQLPAVERKGRMAKAQDERGPLGRVAKVQLQSSEELDQDDGAEALVQRRIQEAEARNVAFSEKDHRNFHDKIKQAEAGQAKQSVGLTSAQLRQAFIWKEVLGPPKALE